METGCKSGEPFTLELFHRLLDEEYTKLIQARDKDVFDVSKKTTLPIARLIAEVYVSEKSKTPWYIDLLNINLNNHSLEVANKRLKLYMDAYRKDGTRITDNLDFN